jgi:hypothetical protein
MFWKPLQLVWKSASRVPDRALPSIRTKSTMSVRFMGGNPRDSRLRLTKTGVLSARQLWRTLLFISGLPTNKVTKENHPTIRVNVKNSLWKRKMNVGQWAYLQLPNIDVCSAEAVPHPVAQAGPAYPISTADSQVLYRVSVAWFLCRR